MADRPHQTSLGAPLSPPRPQPIDWPAWQPSDTLLAELDALDRAVIRHPDDPRLQGIILR